MQIQVSKRKKMSCEEVHCISKSVVRPSGSRSETTNKRIDLTVWDLKLLRIQYMQKGLLFTNPRPEKLSKEEETNMISHLKTSLSRTLDHFFPLAGRLAITEHDDATISVYINCNSAGAEFIHATADTTVADILNATYVPHIVHSFFPLKAVLNYDGQSQPLLSVQVTKLIDGMFIGCSINHVVCDGTSVWHFLNSWSEISRGSDHISHAPILNRWFLKNTDCPIHFPFPHDEPLPKRHTPVAIEQRIFHFNPENIARFKAQANSERETVHCISSLQALLAHIWLAVTRARCLDPGEETNFLIVIGNRTRLDPPLSKAYFGNSTHGGVATAKVGELLNRGLSWGAMLLNQVVMSGNDATIRSSWESWVEKPVFLFSNNYVSHKHILRAWGSHRFNMYGNDFGWGRPVAVRNGPPAGMQEDGKITVSPGPVEGSIDIELCLSLGMLKAMGDDAEFMETVTILPPPLRSV